MVKRSQLSGKVSELVDHLRSNEGDKLELADVASVTEVLIETMQAYFQSIDSNIYSEFKELSDYLDNARAEIAELTPTDIKTARLPRAGQELDAIVRATEEATNGIMESAEAIMNAEAEDVATLKETIDAHCMHIFEQCSFQDITGQRISKVVQTLQHIENRIDALRDIWGVDEETAATVNEDPDAELMRGPALDGEGIDQSVVDELIGEDGAASQGTETDTANTAPAETGEAPETDDAPAGNPAKPAAKTNAAKANGAAAGTGAGAAAAAASAASSNAGPDSASEETPASSVSEDESDESEDSAESQSEEATQAEIDALFS